VLQELKTKKILAGLALKNEYPGFPDGLLIAVTETKTQQDLNRFITTMKEIMNLMKKPLSEQTVFEKNSKGSGPFSCDNIRLGHERLESKIPAALLRKTELNSLRSLNGIWFIIIAIWLKNLFCGFSFLSFGILHHEIQS